MGWNKQLLSSVIRTSACRFGLIPLRIVRVHAFNGDRTLFQSVARVAGKLHHSSHSPRTVPTGQVTIFNEGFIAVSCCKGCETKKMFAINMFSTHISIFIKEEIWLKMNYCSYFSSNHVVLGNNWLVKTKDLGLDVMLRLVCERQQCAAKDLDCHKARRRIVFLTPCWR